MLRDKEKTEINNLIEIDRKRFFERFQSNPIKRRLLEFNKEKKFSVRDLFK